MTDLIDGLRVLGWLAILCGVPGMIAFLILIIACLIDDHRRRVAFQLWIHSPSGGRYPKIGN